MHDTDRNSFGSANDVLSEGTIVQTVPFHVIARVRFAHRPPQDQASKKYPTAMQAVGDTHETDFKKLFWEDEELGEGTIDHCAPSQISTRVCQALKPV